MSPTETPETEVQTDETAETVEETPEVDEDETPDTEAGDGDAPVDPNALTTDWPTFALMG